MENYHDLGLMAAEEGRVLKRHEALFIDWSLARAQEAPSSDFGLFVERALTMQTVSSISRCSNE